MLAEKAKQQEEMLLEYDESEANKKDLESELDLLRAQVDSMKDELKVSVRVFLFVFAGSTLKLIYNGVWNHELLLVCIPFQTSHRVLNFLVLPKKFANIHAPLIWFWPITYQGLKMNEVQEWLINKPIDINCLTKLFLGLSFLRLIVSKQLFIYFKYYFYIAEILNQNFFSQKFEML